MKLWFNHKYNEMYLQIRKNVDKNQVINGIYNLMNLRDDRMVVIKNNNNSAQVINESDIKKVSECILNQYMILILLKLRNPMIP